MIDVGVNDVLTIDTVQLNDLMSCVVIFNQEDETVQNDAFLFQNV